MERERPDRSSTDRAWTALVRAMQASLLVALLVGIWSRRVGLLVNAGASLAVTFAPALVRRRFGVSVAPGLAVWLALAPTLHAGGVVFGLYEGPGWDYLTHTVSASVAAAVGYTLVRTFDRHSGAVELPARFTFAFVLLFTMAAGVAWEVLEFGLQAAVPGASIQRGLADTMVDLLFDLAGGLVVATLGTAYLEGLAGQLAATLAPPDEGDRR